MVIALPVYVDIELQAVSAGHNITARTQTLEAFNTLCSAEMIWSGPDLIACKQVCGWPVYLKEIEEWTETCSKY